MDEDLDRTMVDLDLEDMELGQMREACLVEKVFGKDKEYRCPLCGEKTRGRRGLNIHLRRTHFPSDEKRTGRSLQKSLSDQKDWSRSRFDQRNELKIQDALVKAIYGSARVRDVAKRYQAGEFSLKDLPINISYWLRLKGIRPEKEPEEVKVSRKDPPRRAEDPGRVSVGRFRKAVEDALARSEDEGLETVLGVRRGVPGSDGREIGFQYVVDLSYVESEKVLKVSCGNDAEEMLKAASVVSWMDGSEGSMKEDPRIWDVVMGRLVFRRIYQKTVGQRLFLVLDLVGEEK